MPNYEFINLETSEIETHKVPISEYDKFKAENPHLSRFIGESPGLSYSGHGDMKGRKTTDGWKEVLHKIAEQNPRSPLADEVLRKTQKRIKVDQIIEKHRKKT